MGSNPHPIQSRTKFNTDPLPFGKCNCGCGKYVRRAKPGEAQSAFLPGHDPMSKHVIPKQKKKNKELRKKKRKEKARKKKKKKDEKELSVIEKVMQRKDRLCKGTKDDGSPCGAIPIKGEEYCWFHLPSRTQRQAKKAKDKLATPYEFSKEFSLDGVPLELSPKYPFMIELYSTVVPEISVYKGTQCGATLSGIVRAYWFFKKYGRKHGRRIIWTMPTDSEVREFSSDRINTTLGDNLNHFVKDPSEAKDWVDNVKMRQVGRNWIYLRGTKGATQHISVPGDMLIHDEVDFSTASVLRKYRSRLGASEFGWIYRLSTPTFEGMGIHADFLRSDQRHWWVNCSECGEPHKVCCEGIDLIDEDTGKYLCRKCGGELDRWTGEWVAERPELSETHAGFHITRTMLPHVSGAELLAEREIYENEQDFYNFVLGLPYSTTENRIPQLALERCFSTSYKLHSKDFDPCTMGIDQGGKHLFVTVTKRDNRNRRQVIWVQQPTTDKAFKQDLPLIMEQFNIVKCVIDGIPNINSASNFAARYPGRVFLHFDNDKIKEAAQWKETNVPPQVITNKAIMMEKMFEEIRTGNLVIPVDEKTNILKKHIANMRKEIVEKNTGPQMRWFSVAADHFNDALLYDFLAGTTEPGLELGITTIEETREKIKEENEKNLLSQLMRLHDVTEIREYRNQKLSGKFVANMLLSDFGKEVFTALEKNHGVRFILENTASDQVFLSMIQNLKETRNATAEKEKAGSDATRPQSTGFSVEVIAPKQRTNKPPNII